MGEKAVIHYCYAGQVERGGRFGYRWYDGYTSSPREMPWRTADECRTEARNEGKRIVFCPNREAGHTHDEVANG